MSLPLKQRKHVHHLKKYEVLTSTKRKRASETPTTTSSIKQTTLVNTRTVSQKSIDKAIVTYVVHGHSMWLKNNHFKIL